MRKVLCSYFNEEKEGMPRVPFPGQVGQELFDNVSQEAWVVWTEMQTKLINEYGLDLSDNTVRDLLKKQMLSFLKLAEEKQYFNFDLIPEEEDE